MTHVNRARFVLRILVEISRDGLAIRNSYIYRIIERGSRLKMSDVRVTVLGSVLFFFVSPHMSRGPRITIQAFGGILARLYSKSQ